MIYGGHIGRGIFEGDVVQRSESKYSDRSMHHVLTSNGGAVLVSQIQDSFECVFIVSLSEHCLESNVANIAVEIHIAQVNSYCSEASEASPPN